MDRVLPRKGRIAGLLLQINLINMKSLFTSRTFWVAVIQAIVGIVVVSLTQLDMVGYVAIVKSIADVILRLVTTEPVTL